MRNTAASGGLVEEAAERLRRKPRDTIELARDVLRLAGPDTVLDAAVRALLGTDARFHVDERGMWSFDGAGTGPPLARLDYAVVDVETTGGPFGSGHRIVEIAIVPLSGGVLGEVWSTLVNPGRPLSWAIESLTGIGQHMVLDAPYFEHVADEVAERLSGRVFVAHNAVFDWRFVEGELVRALGCAPIVDRLCTVRLTRRLIPRLRRRSLDAVTRHFGIPVLDRHRAPGDALATARVLLRLLDEARVRGLGDLRALQGFLASARHRRRGSRGAASPS